MAKNTLLDKGYSFERKKTKRLIVIFTWMLISLPFIIMSSKIILTTYRFDSPERLYLVDFGNIAYVLIIILSSLLYLGLKLKMTSLYCDDKILNIRFKVILEDSMPVCSCREALKIWQIILIYFIPSVLTYSILAFITLSVAYDVWLALILLVVSIIIAYDFTLIIYLLLITAQSKPDYIAINNHIHDITLYKKQRSL